MIFLSLIGIIDVIPTRNVTVNPSYMYSTRIFSIIVWNLFLNACKCMDVVHAYACFSVSLCSWVEVYMHIHEHVHVETGKQSLRAASETLPTSLKTRTLVLEFIN